MEKGIKIDIDGNWGIMSDEYCYILGKWTEAERKRDGEKVTVKTLKKRTFHKNLEQLFKAYVHKRLRTEREITSFKQLIDFHKVLLKKVEEIKEKMEG